MLLGGTNNESIGTHLGSDAPSSMSIRVPRPGRQATHSALRNPFPTCDRRCTVIATTAELTWTPERPERPCSTPLDETLTEKCFRSARLHVAPHIADAKEPTTLHVLPARLISRIPRYLCDTARGRADRLPVLLPALGHAPNWCAPISRPTTIQYYTREPRRRWLLHSQADIPFRHPYDSSGYNSDSSMSCTNRCLLRGYCLTPHSVSATTQ